MLVALASDGAAGGLDDAGSASGGELVETGREREQRVLDLARLLGWLTCLIPGLLLVSRWRPGRVALVRRLREASGVLEGGDVMSPERRQLPACERDRPTLRHAAALHTRTRSAISQRNAATRCWTRSGRTQGCAAQAVFTK